MPARVSLVPLEAGRFESVEAIEVADHQRAFLDTPVLSEFLADAHEHPTYRSYAIADEEGGGRIMGYLSLGYIPGEPETWWIPLLIVDRHYQDRGFGRAALRAALELCRGLAPGCKRIGLSYKPSNVVAARLYREAGFQTDGKLDDKAELVAWLHFPAEDRH